MRRFICVFFCFVFALACFGQTNPSADAKKKVASVQAVYAKTKRAYFRAPRDLQKRAAYIGATTKLADTYMTILGLPPKDKYPNALKYYREVLKTDPKNKHASDSANLIISIYKSMNKPVPKP